MAVRFPLFGAWLLGAMLGPTALPACSGPDARRDAGSEVDAAEGLRPGADVLEVRDAFPDAPEISAEVGGGSVLSFEATGFFRTAFANERWWLVTPEGQAFYSVGINNAGPGGYVDGRDGSNPYAAAVAALYPDEGTWAATAGDLLAAYAEATGLPILITEFSFRALDSGLPNSYPPIYPKLATQTQRADRFEAYAREAYARPWIVGHHWFEYVDEPPGGRFDGENSNFGLVSSADVPWSELTNRMTAVHADAPPSP
jgi:agarase